jgi:hypothetical protein
VGFEGELAFEGVEDGFDPLPAAGEGAVPGRLVLAVGADEMNAEVLTQGGFELAAAKFLFPSSTCPARMRWCWWSSREAWGDAYEGHELVFTRENGAPLRPEYVTRRFNALSRAAGLRHVRLHDLRHGAASLMLSAGVPMAIVSKMLRHSSIGITVDTYHHLSEDSARAASDAIGELLDRAFERTATAARDHITTTNTAEVVTNQTDSEITAGQRGGPVGIEPTTRGLTTSCMVSVGRSLTCSRRVRSPGGAGR